MLQVSLSEDIKLYLLDSDINKATPRQITEDVLIQKAHDLLLSGRKLLGVDKSDESLLEDDIEYSKLSIFERKQLASLLSTRAHLYSYQALKAKKAEKTTLRDNYRTLYNKADMINPARLLRTHEYS